MFTDAKSLWQSASSVLSQALENLDAEIRSGDSDKRNDHDERTSQLELDLESYKKLVEDAQMNHFELSKQSRIVIAEKEAEIQHLKSKLDPALASVANVEGGELQIHKILSEKKVLEESLLELEQRLRDSLSEKNKLLVMKKEHDDLAARFEMVKGDLMTMKSEFEVRDRDRNETVENLVAEYSKLAAETELMQQKSDLRIAEVMKENEVLATKLHALEHSIAELADRASTQQHNSPSTGVSGAEYETIQRELKEAKKKIVTLQFDLKEREDEVKSLKTQHSQPPTPASPQRKAAQPDEAAVEALREQVATLEQERQCLQQALSKAQDVAAEAHASMEQECAQLKEEAATAFTAMEQECAQLKKEAAIAHAAMEQQRMQGQNDSAQTLQAQAALGAEKDAQVDALTRALKEKEAALLLAVEDVSAKSRDLQALDQQLQACQKELDEARNDLATKEGSVSQLQVQVQQLSLQGVHEVDQAQQQVSTQQAVVAELQHQLEMLQQELVADKAALAAALQSSNLMQGELQALRDQLADALALVDSLRAAQGDEQRSVQLLDSELRAVKDALAAKEGELEVTTARLAAAEVDLETQKVSFAQQLCALETQALRDGEEKERALQDQLQMAAVEHERTVTALQQQHAEVLSAELEAQLSTIRAQYELDQQAALQLHQQELTQSVAAAQEQLRAAMTAESAAEVAKVSAELAEDKRTSLEELRMDLDVTHGQALESASRTHSAEVARLKDEAAAQLQAAAAAAQNALDAVVAEKDAALAVLQQQLATISQKAESEKEAALQAQAVALEETKQQALAALRKETQDTVNGALAERDEHLANYTKERKARKKLHNKLLEMQGNIRVMCRVRPILEVERKSGEDVDISEIPNDEELYILRDSQTKTKYEYDRVFGQGSSQEEVFEAVQPLCVSVLDGYNVCIFAYGQTGSGKTYTMEGYGPQIGVSPRAIAELLKQVEDVQDKYTYTLTMSMLEIYNETIRDLLDASKSKDKEKLDVRQTPEGNQVIGLTEVTITNMDQVRELMVLGHANRAVGSHDMNEHSSRSHSILTITARGKNKVDSSTTFGKLHLIDLAGSERVGKTDATGDRLKEAQNINKSLLALGDVVNALGNKKSTHVPYRNSKLTFLLQDSLGGNSKVMTFVNISPASYNLGETVCSLNFASRCRATELGQAKRQSDMAPPSTPSGEGSNSAKLSASSTLKRSTMSAGAATATSSLHSSASMSNLVSPAPKR